MEDQRKNGCKIVNLGRKENSGETRFRSYATKTKDEERKTEDERNKKDVNNQTKKRKY